MPHVVQLVLVFWLAGCLRPASAFRCSTSEQCTDNGICQVDGLCSFADPGCSSGQRYGAASGALGGSCVDSELDGGVDGHVGPCDPTSPFNLPELVGSLNSAVEDGSMRLSSDELTAYFFSARATSSTGTAAKRLFVASRTAIGGPFSNVTKIADDGVADQYQPTVSADGLTLFFASYRSNSNNIYQATRAAITDDFSNIAPVSPLNTTASEVQPHLTRDGSELYFARGARSTIMRATGNAAGGFTNPQPVSELDDGTNDTSPVLSADGLTMYWGSDRVTGVFHVWQAHRATTLDRFQGPISVDSVNATGPDFPSDISPDGCRLYLTSTRGTKPVSGLYVATRTR